jgi:hypothetical protein
MCLFQLFVASSRLEIFSMSLQELPAVALPLRKNRFQNFKTFHFYLENKRFEDLKIENFNPKQSLNFGIFKYLN